jgi:hypothetical protein
MAQRRRAFINASVKKEAAVYFTAQFPNFIQTAGSVDGASVCAKLVSMMHDLPVDDEDATIICQIDFANAFQTPSRQLGTNDCILGIASRTYDQERVQIGDPLPHLIALKKFFPYFRGLNDVASRNRFTDYEGTTHFILGSRGGIQGDPLEMTRFCLTVHPIWGRVLGRHQARRGLRRRRVPHGQNKADAVSSRRCSPLLQRGCRPRGLPKQMHHLHARHPKGTRTPT